MLHGAENVDERGAQAFLQGLDILQLLTCQPLVQVRNDLLGRIDADVRHDEETLEFLERVLVDLAARRQVREIVGKPAVSPVDARAQALDEAFLVLGLFLFPKHVVTIPSDAG